MLSIESPSDYASNSQYQLQALPQHMDYYGQYQTWEDNQRINNASAGEHSVHLTHSQEGVIPQFPPVSVDLPQISGETHTLGESSTGSGTGNDSMEGLRVQALPSLGSSMSTSPLLNNGGAVTKLRKTKKKKKRDPHEPQKPVSAYALFFRDTQSSIKAKKPDASFGEISKLVASMWDNLEQDQKTEYKRRTETAKKEYLRKLAAYKARMVSREVPMGYGTATSYMNLNYYQPQNIGTAPHLYPSGQGITQAVPTNYYTTLSQQHIGHQAPLPYTQSQMSPVRHHGMMVHGHGYSMDDVQGHHQQMYLQSQGLNTNYQQHSIPLQQEPPRGYTSPMHQMPIMESGSPCTYHQTTSPGSTCARDSASPVHQTQPQLQYISSANDNLVIGQQWTAKKDEQYSALVDDTNGNSVRDIYYWMSRQDAPARDISDRVV